MTSPEMDADSTLYARTASSPSTASSTSSKLRGQLELLDLFSTSATTFDLTQYNNVIEEIVASLDHMGTIGELFDNLKDELGPPSGFIHGTSINSYGIEQAITQCKTLGFLRKMANSSSKARSEVCILNSVIVWYLHTLFHQEYNALVKHQHETLAEPDTGLFISLGYYLAALLRPGIPLSKGMLLEINMIELIIEVGISFHVTPETRSTRFIIMLSAIIVSHISISLLNDSLIRALESNRKGYSVYDKWTNFFMAYCPVNHILQATEGPSIFELFNRARMLPMVHPITWSLDAHYSSIFADIQVADYIPIATELLIRSKRKSQDLRHILKSYDHSSNHGTLARLLGDIVTSFKGLLGQDINILTLSGLDILDGLSRVISSNPGSGIAENCKTIYGILVEKHIRHFCDIEMRNSDIQMVAKRVSIPSDFRLDELGPTHFEILFELIDGPDYILKNVEYAPLLCLATKVMEKSTQTLNGVREMTWCLSTLDSPLSAMAIVSHLIFRLSRYLLKDLGQPYDARNESLFERAVPPMTLGEYGDRLTNEKGASLLRQIAIKDDINSCVLLLVMILYRNLYLCANIFRDSGEMEITWIRENELQMVTGALLMAFDLATISYPTSAGNATLKNVIFETFCLISEEYGLGGSLVLQMVSAMAATSLKFNYISRDMLKTMKRTEQIGFSSFFRALETISGQWGGEYVDLKLGDFIKRKC